MTENQASTGGAQSSREDMPAQFWAVDLHVHTPASADVLGDRYGGQSPSDVVEAALRTGLDAIAITDHNTADWCEPMVAAATGTSLVVLPGVEVTSSEGHILAVWEERTEARVIEDLLTTLGIPRSQQGAVEVSSPKSIVDVAKAVDDAGGLAIAAHIDRPRGLMRIEAADHLRRALLTPQLAALEIHNRDTEDTVHRKLDDAQACTFVQGSDVFAAGGDTHELAAIGRRRTWIKASRPDLVGIRHALADPSLRVRLDPPEVPSHCWIKSVRVHGGFLGGQEFEFSSDLNCLLGGTGTGKSLLIELIRFAVNQQAPGASFEVIRDEVERRLGAALGTNSHVELSLMLGDDELVVRRVFDRDGSPPPEIISSHGRHELTRTAIRAFSQGEVIEYARQPVGRLQLVDSALDLGAVETAIGDISSELADNGDKITAMRERIAEAEATIAAVDDVEQRVKELAALFDSDVVKRQRDWAREAQYFETIVGLASERKHPALPNVAEFRHDVEVESNAELYERTRRGVDAYNTAVDEAQGRLDAARDTLVHELREISAEWKSRLTKFERELSAETAKVAEGGEDLDVLRRRLMQLQREKSGLDQTALDLSNSLKPKYRSLLEHREELIDRLVGERRKRRDMRQARVRELNKRMGGAVRLRLDQERDAGDFRRELARLAKGSHFSKRHLDLLEEHASPIHLVRSFIENDTSTVAKSTSVPEDRVRVLFDHIADRRRVADFLDLQYVEVSDALGVQFRKPSTTEFEDIENLAHGQKCTAILIVAMAEGHEPLVVDQPEDALHAPWIEEHLVSRLRDMRGDRQYIFATRSPGIVASADAEMIFALEASASRGNVAMSGSLERHDLNMKALYHLEGGVAPFNRRKGKFRPSL